MDAFHMTSVRNATFYKLKKTAKKHPVYEDKSDTKVIKVRKTLMGNFMFRTIFAKFWYMLYYCRPTMNFYKIFYQISEKKV